MKRRKHPDPKIWDIAERSLALANEIKPMLAGKGEEMQGATLAELVATWLGGQNPAFRELAFEEWKKAVWNLTEVSTPWLKD